MCARNPGDLRNDGIGLAAAGAGGEPMKHAEYREKVIEPHIKLLHDLWAWTKPAR
jgi:hypothetical protein